MVLWALFTVLAAVLIFVVVFALFPWGREVRNPEKTNRWMFLRSGRGA